MKKIKKEYVKRSIVIHPINDGYINRLRAIILDRGIDLSYSSAVNAMLIGHVLSVAYGREEGLKLMWNFIFDEKTIKEINKEDAEERWKEEMRKKLARIME